MTARRASRTPTRPLDALLVALDALSDRLDEADARIRRSRAASTREAGVAPPEIHVHTRDGRTWKLP